MAVLEAVARAVMELEVEVGGGVCVRGRELQRGMT